MGKKKQRFGVKFQGKVEEIAFWSSSSSGSVFGVTHSNKHITVINERNAISSHITTQDAKKWNHLGRLSKNEINESFWLEILKPRKLQDNELDQTMLYFTKKLVSVLNMSSDMFIKETDDKSMSYLDLDAIFERSYSFLQNLQQSPNAFLGLCSVRQMLSSEDIEFGQLENGKSIMRTDKELYEMDLSALQEALSMQKCSKSENPMLNMLKSIGMVSLQEGLTERLKEVLSKVQRKDK